MNTFAQRLRTRLVVIALVATLPAIGATLYIQSTERQVATERATRENLRLLRLAASQQGAVFDSATRMIGMLSRFPALLGSDPTHCTEVLQSTLANQPDYYNLGVTWPDGTPFCSARPVDKAQLLAGRRRIWFDRALQHDGPVTGDYQISATSGKPTIIVAQAVRDSSGAVRRVIGAAIAIARLNAIVADAELPDDATLTLFDRTGTIVARYPDGEAWSGHQLPDRVFIQPILEGASSASGTFVGIDGISRIYVNVPIRASIETGLYLGLGVRPETAFAASQRTFVRYLWLLLFVTLVAVTASLAAGHLFVMRPVAELNDTSRRTAQELQDAEGRYKQLFENNPHPMWAYDRLTLKFLEVNGAAVRTYGYSRDEFLGMRVTDIRPPEDVPRLEENLRANREPWAHDGRWRHRLKNGDVIDVEITSHLFMFEGRDAELITAHDVTDRSRAQAALAERTALTALTADIGVALNLSRDLRRCLLRCAQAVVAHLEPNAVRIRTIGQTGELAIDVTAGDGVPDDNAELQYLLAVGTKVVGTMLILASPRMTDPVTTGLAAVADVMALGIERHIADHARREAEDRMRFALEAAGVGVWEADLRTGAAYWSEMTERMHGLAVGSFEGTGEAFYAAVHPDDRDYVREVIATALRDRHNADFEYRTLWPDRTVRRISASGHFTFDASGRATRAAGVVMDITDRRSLEDQLRQAQKMEAVGQLAGGVAHDFNNLLTAIQGFAGLVADTFGENDERLREIAEIQRAADRAAALTRQLLAFSRKQMLAVRVLSVGEIVDGLAPMLRRLLGETIELTTKVDDRARVKADPGQLEQVVLNLAVNARDAMGQGGKLTLATEDIVLDEAFVRQHPSVVAGPHVRLTVTDTGCGMDAATQKRIFEPFFTTKPKDRGTGLGLATVYGIVKQSGGSIWVTSAIGAGTTFTVYLPCTEEAPQTKLTHEARRVARGAESILVVEDEPLIREYVSTVLTRRGYRVHTVGDPEQAIEYAAQQEEPIDLVFTDVVLPGISGPAMVTRMQAQHPDARVLYMSGYVDHSVVPGGMIQPGTAFLQKPFTADALANKVRDVLDSGPSRASA